MKNTIKSKKNKLILTIISVIFYVACFLGLIVIIWNPKKGLGVSRYDTNVNYFENMSKIYLGKLNRLLLSSNTDKLYEFMDKSYINNNNLTVENFKEFLIKKRLVGDTINIYEYTYSQSNDISVFVFKYRCNGFDRIANVIETKPYEYVISFEQNYIPGMNSIAKVDSYGLNITVENTKRTESSIYYKLNIKNNSNQNVGIDLTTINNVALLMSDGNLVNMMSTYSDNSLPDVLTTNQAIEKEVIFAIPSSYQGKIKAFVIKDVDFNGTKRDIQVTF